MLHKPIELQEQDGDAFLLDMAQAADINLICAAWSPLADVQPKQGPAPGLQMIVRLLEMSRDCSLSWWRAGERTIVMWPQPDEEKLGQAWTRWFREQQVGDEAIEAVSDEEAAQALERLKVEDTVGTREVLRQAYRDLVHAQMQRRVRDQVQKYLQEHPQNPQTSASAPEQSAQGKGPVIEVRALPAALRQEIEVLARLQARQHWSPWYNLWYSPQRAEFWKQARLSVLVGDDASKTRWLQLKGPDAGGAVPGTGFTVGRYDPRNAPMGPTPPFHFTLTPRPASGLRLRGSQMPLRQVLDEVQKQSGLAIEAPLERLSKARLSLDVRGMEAPEFLAALARTFLIEWKVEGRRVTARERDDSESDRFLLQLGNLKLYRNLSRAGLDDWREESELARAVHDEAGDAIFSPEGVAVSQLSPEVQDGVRREAQEDVLSRILRDIPAVLPVSMEQARLVIGNSPSRPGIGMVLLNNKPAPGFNPTAPQQAINLMVPSITLQEITPLDDPLLEHPAIVTLAAQPAGVLRGQVKADALVEAFQIARQKEEQRKSQFQAHIERETEALMQRVEQQNRQQ